MLAIALGVVWASYLAIDPHLRWIPDPNVPVLDPGGLGGLIADWLPVPVSYQNGLRIQFRFEDQVFGGFLFGEQYEGSRWYYLPVALAIKEPLGALALWLVGAAAMLSVRRLRSAALYTLVPTGLLLAAAMNGSRDWGVRYAIFVPILLAVVAAAVLALRPHWAHATAAALVLFAAVSSLKTFPYYLPYSNEAFGGPSKTWQRLHDSNADWGQDLKRTAAWLNARYPDRPVWLDYHGGGHPAYYGMMAADPEQVSLDKVRGLIVMSNSSIDRGDDWTRELVATSHKIGEVGYSMTIFQR
jgi:hypothetical protein